MDERFLDLLRRAEAATVATETRDDRTRATGTDPRRHTVSEAATRSLRDPPRIGTARKR